MNPSPDMLVTAYMRQLERELRAFPELSRREILEEVAEHIEQGRAELETETEAGVRNLLDRLGEPSDIAAAARERYDLRKEAGALEIVTVVALVIPYLGWLAATALVWMSRVWRRRDKVLTSILVPGALALLLGFVVPAKVSAYRTSGSMMTSSYEVSGGGWLGATIHIAVYVLPLVTALYLAIRARRLSDAAPV